MEALKHHEFFRSHEILSPSIIIALVVLLALTIFIRFLQPSHSLQEPTVVPQGIPYIGHVVGIIRHGLSYYQVVFERVRLPIYTLDFMSSKTYVITSLELIKAAQMKKTLSFNPFMTSWLKPLYNMDDDAMAIMKNNMDCEQGDFGYMKDSYEIHHGMLSLGHKTFNDLTRTSLEEFADLINQVHDVKTDLYSWVQHVSTIFSTNAMWGPENPFKDPQVEKGFWTFERKFHLLLLNFLPKYISSGGYDGREKAYDGFCKYYKDGIPTGASELVHARIEVGRKYGMSIKGLARLDVGLAQALLINTVPITAWMLLYIFASPTLLAEIREEVSTICEKGNMNQSKMRKQCPLLVSTWNEVLRFTSYLPQGRTVLEDSVLEDRYVLEKGATVLIPSGIIHGDTAIWGDDAAAFNPRRFLGKEKRGAAAFRSFGGGSLMCPGRHFAFTEVSAFVATLVMAFDIVLIDGKTLQVPSLNTFSPSLGVLKPQASQEVRISRRKGWEEVRWTYETESH